MADNEPGNQPHNPEPTTESPEAAKGTPVESVHQQRVSGILRAVLEEELPPESAGGKSPKRPWYIDGVFALGILLVVGGFTAGLWEMFITHAAHQSIAEGNYEAAIALLKGNPVPRFVNFFGGDPNQDPDELLASALYLEAMRKFDSNDIKGGMLELQQIRAGTNEFDTAQEILTENFEPSATQLTGGVTVENAAAAHVGDR